MSTEHEATHPRDEDVEPGQAGGRAHESQAQEQPAQRKEGGETMQSESHVEAPVEAPAEEATTQASGEQASDTRTNGESTRHDERMRVLRLLSEGRITPAEAEQLLAALASPESSDTGVPEGAGPFGPGFPFGRHNPFGPGFPFGRGGPGAPGGAAGRGAWGVSRGPHQVSVVAEANPGAPPMPATPPKPPTAPAPPTPPDPPGMAGRSLLFRVEDGEKSIKARLPLTLVLSADRFLPRDLRGYLDGFGVDLAQIHDLVQSLHGLPDDTTLLDMEDGEKSVKITLE